MTVKLKLVNGNTEIFQSDSYVVSKTKEMHPDILDCKVYLENGKLLAHRKRNFQKIYCKYFYKPLPKQESEKTE